MRFAYADPPYPGTAKRYYGKEDSFGGEVDHRELIASILHGGYDGWALSTSAKALRDVLPLCPDGTRVCAWTKPGGVPPGTIGRHNVWEALLVVGGRLKRPGTRDCLVAHSARLEGVLPGRKPIAFIAWLFDLLGMEARDQLDDLFPGSRIVGASAISLGMTLGPHTWPSGPPPRIGPPRPPTRYIEDITRARVESEELLSDTVGGFFEPTDDD